MLASIVSFIANIPWSSTVYVRSGCENKCWVEKSVRLCGLFRWSEWVVPLIRKTVKVSIILHSRLTQIDAGREKSICISYQHTHMHTCTTNDGGSLGQHWLMTASLKVWQQVSAVSKDAHFRVSASVTTLWLGVTESNLKFGSDGPFTAWTDDIAQREQPERNKMTAPHVWYHGLNPENGIGCRLTLCTKLLVRDMLKISHLSHFSSTDTTQHYSTG